MKWSKRREAFREILNGNRCVVPASVFDAVSARLAQDVGYEAAIIAGSAVALAALGGPDENVITLTELVDQTHRINRATDLPLLVDADTGFGNALNVMRTIQELETVGAAAIKIEDTVAPMAYRGKPGWVLLPVDEAADKIRAAVSARVDKSMAIIARTPSAQVGGIDALIERVPHYEAAGADGLFVIGVKTRAELDKLAEVASVPLLLGARNPALSDFAYLASRRVRINHLGNFPVEAAIVATRDMLKQLLEKGIPTGPKQDGDIVAQVTRQKEYDGWIQEFMAV